MDIVVAAGLLQLSPKKVTPRVTGAFGFASSLISCYQVLTYFITINYLYKSKKFGQKMFLPEKLDTIVII